MGAVYQTPKALSVAQGQDRVRYTEDVANLSFRGAGCLSWARPVPWELGEGNLSLLPDRNLFGGRGAKWLSRPTTLASIARMLTVMVMSLRL